MPCHQLESANCAKNKDPLKLTMVSIYFWFKTLIFHYRFLAILIFLLGSKTLNARFRKGTDSEKRVYPNYDQKHVLFFFSKKGVRPLGNRIFMWSSLNTRLQGMTLKSLKYVYIKYTYILSPIWLVPLSLKVNE